MRGNSWIKVWRDLADRTFWLSEPFTRAQAWVDLQLLACGMWDEENQPGDVKCSLRYLARRWQWSTDKVKGFLQHLDRQGWIDFPLSQDGSRTDSRTLLRLVNYRFEQEGPDGKPDRSHPNRTENRTDNRAGFRTPSGHAGAGFPGNYRTESRTDFRAKMPPNKEEYRRTCRAAEASGTGEKIIPAEYRDRFQTWEEYIEWRYQ